MSYIMKLTPALKDYIWGGDSLKEYYPTSLDRISEAWVLSCHKDGKSVVANGELCGKTLDEAISSIGREAALGPAGADFEFFPILIKLIDSAQNLSVQVHPDDDYARKAEGEYGKTEMWYILDAKRGAGIYYGFKKKTSREDFEAAIKNNTLTDLLRFVEVKPGECYFIPSGTIHAIGAGITIAEVQQNSNTTYRVYDFGRVGKDGKPRELHIAKALDVTSTEPASGTAEVSSDNPAVLARCRYFTAKRLILDGTARLECNGSFLSVLIANGEGKIGDEKFGRFDSFFIPADLGCAELSGKAEIIISSVER
ncbi:MAG: type I phosphomannose isomerase catalytic subunit [Acutalibacteraceae bacterium]